MNEIVFYQNYWWLLIAILGAALVFMLFVLGGQTMLQQFRDDTDRQLMVNSLGRKWELSFTSLVVFGGAFFASFPLFYSTSFGGAYWLWMTILLSFVVQAVSYEFRRKQGNLYGRRLYDFLLLFNGVVGSVLLGAAVAMFYFGAPFVVERGNLAEGINPVISVWAPSHGLEIMSNWRCLLLGVTVLFLARTLGALYFINNIDGSAEFMRRLRRSTLVNGLVFAVLFVIFTIILLTTDGVRNPAPGVWERESFLYLHNLLNMWWWGVIFVVGVLFALAGIAIGAFTSKRSGIWFSGVGVIMVIVTLFAIAAYNHTAYLPSATDISSSLTLANSSSSLFTLKVMSWVSLLIPIVVIYIWIVWSKMNIGGLSRTDIAPDKHQY